MFSRVARFKFSKLKYNLRRLQGYERVTIRPGFPGHVLFLRLQNCVRGNFSNFTKMPGFIAFVYSHTQFFGGPYVRHSSQFSQATFQLQNLFSQSLPVDPTACWHSPVPGVHFDLCAVQWTMCFALLLRVSLLSRSYNWGKENVHSQTN
jgi:hypothetical protein